MKTRFLVGVLLVLALLAGCVGIGETASAFEVRPGVYMSSDPADFPFPTSGYSVYIVGESHGNREVKMVFQAYLKKLYEEAKLRNVILEEDQAHETEANANVHGMSDKLPDELCLRADVLGIIRDFNAGIPDDEKVTVHLVDIDSPLSTIYKHLAEINHEMGTSGDAISFPDFPEFRTWHGREIFALIEEMQNTSRDQTDLINELETVKLSLDWYYLGNRLEIGWPRGIRAKFAPIREDVITKNVKYVLSSLNGKPVLAYFGLFHGMKVQADPNSPIDGFKAWAERLVDENVKVYSLAMFGVFGESYWHERTLSSDEEFLKDFQLEDGTPVVSLLDTPAASNIVYTDLQAESNSTIRLSPYLLDLPASQLFDGIIVFKEFTPMEDACPK